MPRTQFKKKCVQCRKNYVLTTNMNEVVICYDCQKSELEGEITDPAMKKLFDIPQEFYEQNMFLRNIKINYLKWKNLTEKQVAAFNKVVDKLKEEKS